MGLGSMRERIELQRDDGTTDANGAHVEQWVTYGQAQTEHIPEGGREFYHATQRYTDLRHLFRVRYSDQIRQDHAVLYGGERFLIVAAWDIDGRRRFMHLACRDVRRA